MKTTELTPKNTYALQARAGGDASPALVLENVLWTERDQWFPVEDQEKREVRRVLRRAEKGERAGTNARWYAGSYRKTGVPVLRFGAGDYRFMASARVRITNTPQELLTVALSKMDVMELVDSGQSIFHTDEDGQSHRMTSTTVWAQCADGSTEEISVVLELVRPQVLVSTWADYIEGAEKAALEKARLNQKRNERLAENTKTAHSIRDRVTALLGDGDNQRYDFRDERYDLRRSSTNTGISTTYLVSQDVLLKLLELAEQGTEK